MTLGSGKRINGNSSSLGGRCSTGGNRGEESAEETGDRVEGVSSGAKKLEVVRNCGDDGSDGVGVGDCCRGGT